MGRLSEEFGGALPTVISAEQQQLPPGFLEEIIEDRAYAHTYAVWRRASETRPTDSDLMRLVKLIDMEIVAEDLEAEKQKKAKANG